jgi:O-6-methylguanine DNA methyltransferase
MRLWRVPIDTPLGEMIAVTSEAGLCALEFTEGRAARGRKVARLARLDARLRRHFPPHTIEEGDTPVIAGTRVWLASYFAGVQPASGVLLDLRGAEFEMRVWRALLTIPAGETRSYGSIAREIGTPSAARAVGMANGANPVAIIVPCHRVIGSSGELTGYGGGLDRKRWLLDHERRWDRHGLFAALTASPAGSHEAL